MSLPQEKYIYTFSELKNEINILLRYFKIIRLVSPETCKTYTLSDDKLIPDMACYTVWNRGRRCEHCLSKKILDTHSYGTKLESISGHIFIVISKYIKLEEREFALEMVTDLTDMTGLGQEEHVIVEIRRLQEENSRLLRDILTNCYSRYYMETYFHEYVHAAKSTGQELCIAMFDMDNFKDINDKYGHTIGDAVLQSCGHFWLKYFDIRHQSFITRYGGDEFVIIAITNGYDEFCQRIASLETSMRKNIVLSDGRTIPFSFTIGCACLSEISPQSNRSDLEALLSLADSRMYMGKNSGRNRIIAHSF